MHAGTFPSGLLCPYNRLNFDQQLPHLPTLPECVTNMQVMDESWGSNVYMWDGSVAVEMHHWTP